MAFDGIVTKAIASELQQLSGARIDKIFQPNKNNIILGFYFNFLFFIIIFKFIYKKLYSLYLSYIFY